MRKSRGTKNSKINWQFLEMTKIFNATASVAAVLSGFASIGYDE